MFIGAICCVGQFTVKEKTRQSFCSWNPSRYKRWCCFSSTCGSFGWVFLSINAFAFDLLDNFHTRTFYYKCFEVSKSTDILIVSLSKYWHSLGLSDRIVQVKLIKNFVISLNVSSLEYCKSEFICIGQH